MILSQWPGLGRGGRGGSWRWPRCSPRRDRRAPRPSSSRDRSRGTRPSGSPTPSAWR